MEKNFNWVVIYPSEPALFSRSEREFLIESIVTAIGIENLVEKQLSHKSYSEDREIAVFENGCIQISAKQIQDIFISIKSVFFAAKTVGIQFKWIFGGGSELIKVFPELRRDIDRVYGKNELFWGVC